MTANDGSPARAGVAAPLALAVLLALALLSALFLDASVADQRAGRAALGAARAAVLAEKALEGGLASRLDTAAASGPVGAVLLEFRVGGVDSTLTTIRRLQPGIAEVQVRVAVHSGGFRVIAGRVAHARMYGDSLVPSDLVLRPLPGAWWVTIP
ncbi:MAG: hypothetical protein P3A28_06835 [Gemmatimonadota bacterium]|nr:hypothetical protein [Gemmatimonadota bacterium]